MEQPLVSLQHVPLASRVWLEVVRAGDTVRLWAHGKLPEMEPGHVLMVQAPVSEAATATISVVVLEVQDGSVAFAEMSVAEFVGEMDLPFDGHPWELVREVQRAWHGLPMQAEWTGTSRLSLTLTNPHDHGIMVFEPGFGVHGAEAKNMAVAHCLAQTVIYHVASFGFTSVGFLEHHTPMNHATPHQDAAGIRQLPVLSDLASKDDATAYLMVTNKAMECAVRSDADQVLITFSLRYSLDIFDCWPQLEALFSGKTRWAVELAADGRRALFTQTAARDAWSLTLGHVNTPAMARTQQTLCFKRAAVKCEQEVYDEVQALRNHIWRVGRFFCRRGMWEISMERLEEAVPLLLSVEQPREGMQSLARIKLRRAVTVWLTEDESRAAWLPQAVMDQLAAGKVGLRLGPTSLELGDFPLQATVHLDRVKRVDHVREGGAVKERVTEYVNEVHLNLTVTDGDETCQFLKRTGRAWQSKPVWEWRSSQACLAPTERVAQDMAITSADIWTTNPARVPVRAYLGHGVPLTHLEPGGELIAKICGEMGIYADGSNAHKKGASHHAASAGTAILKVPRVVARMGERSLGNEGARHLLPLTPTGEVDPLRICRFGDDEPELLNEIAKDAGVDLEFHEHKHAMYLDVNRSLTEVETLRRACSYIRAMCASMESSIEEVEAVECVF